jgi:signal transduction histidine kinase
MNRKLAVFAGAALWTFATMGGLAAEPRRVLLLHAFGHAYSPWSDMAASFRSDLIKHSSEPTEVFEASLDTARVRQAGDDRPFVDYFRALFSKQKLDLIAAVGAPAAYFMQRNRAQLFPTTPMVIVGADVRRISRSAFTPYDTAVSLDLDLANFVEHIVQIRPETTEVAIVVGGSPIEKYWASELRRELQRLPGIKIQWLTDLTLAELIERAAKMPPQAAIFWYLFLQDGAGVPYSDNRPLRLVREASTVPIFGVGDYQLGQGIVGGPLIQTNALGQQAAKVALRILSGESPADIDPPVVRVGAYMYDWRELRRWNIQESMLPPGSIVQFREPPIWDQYWQQILLAAAVIVVQALLIVGLLRERRSRTLAEVEVRHRMAELALMNRRAVAGQLSASIAHEINQPLAAIVTSGGAALRWLNLKTPNLEEVRSSLQNIVSDGHRAAEVLESVRGIFKKDAQRKTTVDVNQIVREVLDLSRSELDKRGISVRNVQTQGLPSVLVDHVQFQQVLLNLIRNAIDAMDAVMDRDRVLRIRTERNETNEIIISIEDSGTGIDPKNTEKVFTPFFTTKPQGMGMGLSICRSIVEAHGGRLTAAPALPNGTRFEIALPT